MPEQERNEGGKFVAKGDAVRVVRSIRLTDETWQVLGEKAVDNDMSRADYLEALAAGEIEWNFDDNDRSSDADFDIDEVVEILKDALTLKANAGGKIKTRIREALEIMGFDSVEDE